MKLLIFALIFNFFSIWYFDWNLHPESKWEHTSDHFVMIIATLGLVELMIKRHERKHHD